MLTQYEKTADRRLQYDYADWAESLCPGLSPDDPVKFVMYSLMEAGNAVTAAAVCLDRPWDHHHCCRLTSVFASVKFDSENSEHRKALKRYMLAQRDLYNEWLDIGSPSQADWLLASPRDLTP